MTPLRERMLEDLRLRGLSSKTQETYVGAVRQLAAHYHQPPDQLDEDELRRYFLYLREVKQVAPSAMTIALSGIKFLYEHTLVNPRPNVATDFHPIRYHPSGVEVVYASRKSDFTLAQNRCAGWPCRRNHLLSKNRGLSTGPRPGAGAQAGGAPAGPRQPRARKDGPVMTRACAL